LGLLIRVLEDVGRLVSGLVLLLFWNLRCADGGGVLETGCNVFPDVPAGEMVSSRIRSTDLLGLAVFVVIVWEKRLVLLDFLKRRPHA